MYNYVPLSKYAKCNNNQVLVTYIVILIIIYADYHRHANNQYGITFKTTEQAAAQKVG